MIVIISLYILLPFGYEFNTKRFDVIFILIHVSSRKSEEKERTIPALSEYSFVEPIGFNLNMSWLFFRLFFICDQ